MIDRVYWVDNLRGFFIVLMVIFHWSLFIPLNLIDNHFVYSLIGDYIKLFNPYRMEILFFISGLVVYRGMKKPLNKYINGKVKYILYPFLIWSLLYYFILNVFTGWQKKEFEMWALNMIFGTTDITWFLYSALIFYLIIRVVRDYNPILVVTFCVISCVILNQIEFPVFMDVGFINIADNFYYFIFFYLADQLNIHEKNISVLSGNKRVIIFSLICFFVTMYLNFYWNVYKTNPINLFFVLFSIPLFVYIFSRFINKESSIFNHFGTNSLVYFLTHFSFLCLFVKCMQVNQLSLESHFIMALLLISAFFGPYLIIKIKKKFNIVNILFEPVNFKFEKK